MARFCRHVDASIIRPRANEILSFLLEHLRGEVKDEALYMILETLNAIMRINQSALDVSSIASMGDAVFDVWLLNATGSPFLQKRVLMLIVRSGRHRNRRRAVRNDCFLNLTTDYRDIGQPSLAAPGHYYQYQHASPRSGYSW